MKLAEQIGETLANERGMPGLGVLIWPEGSPEQSTLFSGTVGEFLLTANRKTVWCIDGGWGGPPGPIHVRHVGGAWQNGGFGGRAWL